MTGCAAIIPARYASTRLPGKPLLADTGKPLIQHVYEQAMQAEKVDRVIVATDDERIFQAVEGFGGQAVMTSPDHPSGSDRVAEVAAGLEEEIVINVQGDEPEISPALLDSLVEDLDADKEAQIATAGAPIHDPDEFTSPHVVKMVLGADRRALYFSRTPIPHGAGGKDQPLAFKHIGVYAYRREALLAWAEMPPVPLEKMEKLEQLRALHHGMIIKVRVSAEDPLGIDTREEYDAFVKRYKDRQQ